MKKSFSTALVVAVLTLASACGGGGDRPSKSDLTDQIVKSASGSITKTQAECAAQAILDSDLSDEAVKAVAEGDTGFKPSADDLKAQETASTDIGKCITPATPSTDATPTPEATPTPTP